MEEQRTTTVREDSAADDRTTVRRENVATASSGGVVARRIVWFIAGVIIAFLAMRFILLLLAANQGNPFVDFVYAVGGLFAAPFYGIFGYTPVYGQFVFETSTLVAIAVYALIAWGLGKLFTLNRPAAV